MRTRVKLFVTLVVILVPATMIWTVAPGAAVVSRSANVAHLGPGPSGGDAEFFGSMAGRPLNSPVVGMASTVDGGGYWLAAADGGVFAFGDAAFYGSVAGAATGGPIVGITADPVVSGYWLVSADGAVHPFGGAVWYEGMAGRPLNAPIVGMASTVDGGGYWLAAADGGVFAFGDATYSGSSVDVPAGPGTVVGIAAFPDNSHYLLATSRGGVSVFGFSGGSWPGGWGQPANGPMVAAANWGTGDDPGWWTVGSDGGVFALGGAPFYGSMGASALNAPIVGMSATPSHHGYWMAASDGGVFAF